MAYTMEINGIPVSSDSFRFWAERHALPIGKELDEFLAQKAEEERHADLEAIEAELGQPFSPEPGRVDEYAINAEAMREVDRIAPGIPIDNPKRGGRR